MLPLSIRLLITLGSLIGPAYPKPTYPGSAGFWLKKCVTSSSELEPFQDGESFRDEAYCCFGKLSECRAFQDDCDVTTYLGDREPWLNQPYWSAYCQDFRVSTDASGSKCTGIVEKCESIRSPTAAVNSIDCGYAPVRYDNRHDRLRVLLCLHSLPNLLRHMLRYGRIHTLSPASVPHGYGL